MTAYYLVFMMMWVPVLRHKELVGHKVRMGFFLFCAFLVIFIGLRHQVGGDWYNYLMMFENFVPYMNYSLALQHDDPGYWLINRLAYDLGWGVYGANFFGALIFIIGLFNFLKEEPNPWLGLAVAFPYLIIVVSMGYTRQGIAIGLIMLGITYLRKDQFIKFVMAVFLAATFHKTAVLMLGIALFNKGRGRFFKILAGLMIGIGMWNAFLAESQAELWHNYVQAQMQSTGAMIRVVMNVVPALLLVLYRKRWQEQFNDYSFWFIIALGSITSLFLVQFASTAVDRIALYFIPIQVIVFGRLPMLVDAKKSSDLIKLLIVAYYFSVLNVWLWLGTFSYTWLPYQNIIFVKILGWF